MQVNYDFGQDCDFVHTFGIKLEDGRVLVVHDTGYVEVYSDTGRSLGEWHTDFAQRFAGI